MFKFKNSLIALGGIFILIGAIAAFTPRTGLGQNPNEIVGPTKPVVVLNSSSQPVPVAAQGTTTVAGTVNAQQSGAWNVGINGTPTIALEQGSIVGLAPGTSVNVNSSETAPVVVRDADHKSMQAVLFQPGTTVAPGQVLISEYIDVDGFQRVSVNVNSIGPRPDLIRQISFQDFFNSNASHVVYADAFAPQNQLFTVVPVHSPRVRVVIINNGQNSESIQGFVYATR